MNNSDYIMYENFDLSSISPIECGGVVKRYFVMYNKKGLKSVFKLIQENSWNYYVVGGCTKILFKDNISFDCILKYDNKSFFLYEDKLICGAGVSLVNLVSNVTSMGYKGFEGLIGIPGCLGGAICNNSGAYGNEIQDNIKYVKYMNKDGKIIKLSRKKCDFRYRHSIFKDDQLGIIIEAEFKLNKGDIGLIKRKLETYMKRRVLTQPLTSKTLGCTFKNPPFLSSGKLIEECDLKNFGLEGVKVSSIHGNFLEFSIKKNTKNALCLIDIIKLKVYNKINLDLDLEILIVG